MTAHPAVKVRTKTSIAGNNGFTLLELIIVIFILGLAASVVLVATGKMHEKTVFNEEARKLFQTLKHAREIALLERKEVILEIDEEGRSYWLKQGGKTGSHTYRLPERLELRGKAIIFFPKGNSSGGTFTLTDGKKQEYTITVDPVLGVPKVGRI